MGILYILLLKYLHELARSVCIVCEWEAQESLYIKSKALIFTMVYLKQSAINNMETRSYVLVAYHQYSIFTNEAMINPK